MKPIFIPLATAIVTLSLMASCGDEATKPNSSTHTIDTLRDTVSLPLCQKYIYGSGSFNDTMLIRNDSVYNILKERVKKATPCKEYIFSEVDFTQYDILWMRHEAGYIYKYRYSLVRNDSTHEYLSISESYRHKDSVISDAMLQTYNQFYRVPKLRNDYTMKFIFKKTILE